MPAASGCCAPRSAVYRARGAVTAQAGFGAEGGIYVIMGLPGAHKPWQASVPPCYLAQMSTASWIAIGIAIGAAIGGILDNLAMGIGIGVALGLAMQLAAGDK